MRCETRLKAFQCSCRHAECSRGATKQRMPLLRLRSLLNRAARNFKYPAKYLATRSFFCLQI